MSAPIIIRTVDLECTGLEPPEVPIELGWSDVVIDPSLSAGPFQAPGASFYVDPAGRPISCEAKAVHHITEADLLGAKAWQEVVDLMLTVEPKPTILAAHNKKFEQLWLTPELTGPFPWICSYKCALRLWTEAPSHSNGTLRYWRDLPVDRAFADQAHRSGPDAYVTAHLLVDMLKTASVEQLIAWSNEPALLTKVRFGKHVGKRWSEVAQTAPDYLDWILRQDFDEDVKHTAKHWLAQSRRPEARA